MADLLRQLRTEAEQKNAAIIDELRERVLERMRKAIQRGDTHCTIDRADMGSTEADVDMLITRLRVRDGLDVEETADMCLFCIPWEIIRIKCSTD